MASRTSVPNSEVLCGKRYTHWSRQRLYYPLSGGRYERKDCVTNDGRVSDCAIVTFVRFAMAELCQVRFQLRMATGERITSNVLCSFMRVQDIRLFRVFLSFLLFSFRRFPFDDFLRFEIRSGNDERKTRLSASNGREKSHDTAAVAFESSSLSEIPFRHV